MLTNLRYEIEFLVGLVLGVTGRWVDYNLPHKGCCSECNGTGSVYSPATNGRCWDCYGTGHVHRYRWNR